MPIAVVPPTNVEPPLRYVDLTDATAYAVPTPGSADIHAFAVTMPYNCIVVGYAAYTTITNNVTTIAIYDELVTTGTEISTVPGQAGGSRFHWQFNKNQYKAAAGTFTVTFKGAAAAGGSTISATKVRVYYLPVI